VGASYPSWGAGVERFEGRIAPGETVKIYVKINPGRAFPIKVTEFVPGQRMVMAGGMKLGLFKGVRTFSLSTQGNGTRQFTMRGEYTAPPRPQRRPPPRDRAE